MSSFGPFGHLHRGPVVYGHDKDRVCCMRGCGKARWGWTNLMEPLCRNHFCQRRVVQNLLVMFSGQGSWASLVIFNNPDGFRPYEEMGT